MKHVKTDSKYYICELLLLQMISRSLIRIKAFKELYSRITVGSGDIVAAEKELLLSLDKTRQLYCLMALLPYSLSVLALDKVHTQERKYSPDIKAIEQNSKFAKNAFSELVRTDSAFLNYCSNASITWNDFETPLKGIYSSMVSKEYFRHYLENPSPSMKDAVELFRHIYSEEVCTSSVLEDALETYCIWWADDLEYVVHYLLGQLNRIVKDLHITLPELFENKEDSVFAKKLPGVVMVDYDDLAETVSSYMQNWDVERVVQSDILLVAMGIAEAITFKDIPLKVTIDEYVEISKYYSTPKSYVFVNGLLHKILKQLTVEGKIEKNPRGLIGGLV